MATSSPRSGPQGPRRSTGQGHLRLLQGRPGQAHPARHRRVGQESEEGHRQPGPSQARPVHPVRRHDEERQPLPDHPHPGRPRTITAADPAPDHLRDVLAAISQATRGAHSFAADRATPSFRRLLRQARHSGCSCMGCVLSDAVAG